MSYPPALFSYAVTPNAVPYSASERDPSAVTLMLAATNPAGQQHDVAQLVFVLPIGDGSGDLTANPVVSCTPALGVPWSIRSDGTGSLTAMPQPPVTGLGPGASIAFFVSGIEVNELPGLAVTTVYEQTDLLRQALLSVSKVPPGLAITTFTASPVQVPPGEPTTLGWQTTGADSVTLSWQGQSKKYPPSGQAVLRPQQTTLYTLTATGSGGSTYQQLTVYVPEVRIVSFGATPAQVPQYGPAILQWRIINADHAYLEPGHQPADPDHGQRPVMPAAPTDYHLVATGYQNTVSMSAFVNVMDVAVDSFTATPSQVPPGAVLPARLAWSTQWATSRVISPGVGEVPASGQANVTPAQTATYSLTAQGYHPVTRNVTVTVAPAIELFSLRAPSPDQIALLWKVVGGSVTLALGGGQAQPYPAAASVSLFSPFPATLTMTVTGLGLSTVCTVSLPGTLAGANLDELTARCDFGINAASATGKLSWRSSGTQVSGQVTAAETIPLTGSDGDLDVPYPASGGSGGVLWSMDFIFGPSSGQRVSWQVHAPTTR